MTDRTLSVALLSKWHVHAVDHARSLMELPDVSIHSVWDEDAARGSGWAAELGVPYEPDLSALLSNPAIDAVVVAASTTSHEDIILAAAKHGKHIFSEKVLALTVADCQSIYATVDAADVVLAVSLPRLTEPFYRFAQETVDRGALGKLTMVRCRVAHGGAIPSGQHPEGWLPQRFFDPLEAGGGALIDLGAHPIYLTNRLAGPAVAVTARLSPLFHAGVDDHAAAIVEYESGALGVIEASFVSGKRTFMLELHGTEGSLLVENYDRVRLVGSRSECEQRIAPDLLPPAWPSPIRQWVSTIRHGATPTITRDDVVGLTRINEAAALSDRTGSRVELR